VIKLITALSIFIGFQALAQGQREIVFKIQKAAKEAGIDPDFAVALATVESGLNPNAVGKLGELGLFQLRREYHDVHPGQTDHNIAVAMNYLSELHTKWAPTMGDSWFVLFNWGPANRPKRPRETAYYKKVMREIGKIKFKRYLASY